MKHAAMQATSGNAAKYFSPPAVFAQAKIRVVSAPNSWRIHTIDHFGCSVLLANTSSPASNVSFLDGLVLEMEHLQKSTVLVLTVYVI